MFMLLFSIQQTHIVSRGCQVQKNRENHHEGTIRVAYMTHAWYSESFEVIRYEAFCGRNRLQLTLLALHIFKYHDSIFHVNDAKQQGSCVPRNCGGGEYFQ